MCAADPMPAVPKVNPPDLCAAMNSASVRAGLSGLTASVVVLSVGTSTGIRSAMANPGLALRLWLMATPVAVSSTV